MTKGSHKMLLLVENVKVQYIILRERQRQTDFTGIPFIIKHC